MNAPSNILYDLTCDILVVSCPRSLNSHVGIEKMRCCNDMILLITVVNLSKIQYQLTIYDDH